MTDSGSGQLPLLLEQDGAVVTITINDPPRNRLGLALMDELEAQTANLAADKSVHAIILRGWVVAGRPEPRRDVLDNRSGLCRRKLLREHERAAERDHGLAAESPASVQASHSFGCERMLRV